MALSKSKDKDQYEERRQRFIDVVGGAGTWLVVFRVFLTPHRWPFTSSSSLFPPPFDHSTAGAIEYLEKLEAGEHWLDFKAPARRYGKRANSRYVFVLCVW